MPEPGSHTVADLSEAERLMRGRSFESAAEILQTVVERPPDDRERQAVLVGGGYATGRELVEFFVSKGPATGLAGLALTALWFSAGAMVSFELARRYRHIEVGLTQVAVPFRDLVFQYEVVAKCVPGQTGDLVMVLVRIAAPPAAAAPSKDAGKGT